MATEDAGVQSVQRALDVLEAVASAGVIGVTLIAQKVGLAPSTAHGLVRTLTLRRYLVRTDDGYRLGPAALVLSAGWDAARTLRPELEPRLLELSSATGLASTATVLVGREARIICSTPSPGPLGMAVAQESWKDPFDLATGRVLVAFEPAQQWALYTAVGTTPVAVWRRELAAIRANGVALKPSRDPRTPVSVALPVIGPGGVPLCAIGCFAPAYLAADVFRTEVVDALWRTCSAIATTFGGEAAPRPDPDLTRLSRHLPTDLLPPRGTR